MALSPEQIEWIEKEVYSICPLQRNEESFCKERKYKIKMLRNQIRQSLIQKLLTKTVDMNKNVRGVNIDISSPGVTNAKKPEDIVKLGFFDHLPEADRLEAAKEVWAEVHPPKATEPVK